jgi:hypothetical protein
MQNPWGAGGATWTCGAFAFAMLTPANAADTTKTAAIAILLSIGFPCGFVVAVSNRRAASGASAGTSWSNRRTMGERPDFNGLGPLNPGIPVSVSKPYLQGDLRSAVRKTP